MECFLSFIYFRSHLHRAVHLCDSDWHCLRRRTFLCKYSCREAGASHANRLVSRMENDWLRHRLFALSLFVGGHGQSGGRHAEQILPNNRLHHPRIEWNFYCFAVIERVPPTPGTNLQLS